MTKIEFNKSEGNIFIVLCQICKQDTRHKVLASVDTSGKEKCCEMNGKKVRVGVGCVSVRRTMTADGK